MLKEFIEKRSKLILILIPVLSFAMHYHVFNLDLIGIHVWRQTQTQTVIHNFVTEDFNILNPKINAKADTDRILRMEFPLMQWLFALFYKLLGDHIAISRLLTFLIGTGSVYGMYNVGKRLFNNKGLATLCALTFAWSPIFYYYTVNPLPDNMALCAAIWSTGSFLTYINNNKSRYLILSALLLCIATLCKLPFILYGAVGLAYTLIQLFKKEMSIGKAFLISLIYVSAMAPAFAWYLYAIPSWQGNGIVKGIFDSNESISNIIHYIYGTLISTLPELLLNYGSVLFFLAGFYFLFQRNAYRSKYFPLLTSLSVAIILYYLFEINMIQLVHDYYLFPFLPLIFLITGYGAYYLLQQKHKALNLLASIAIIILPLTAFLRADSRWDTANPGFNATYYEYKNELRKLIPEDAKCITGNDMSSYITLYYINRKGWSFFDNNLPEEQLNKYLANGASYLFSDCGIENNEYIQKHISGKIFEKGTLRVYKLK